MPPKSKYKVVAYPDPRLSIRSAEVSNITQEIRTLVKDMFDIMYQDGGVGLAAPQIGISLRVFVANPTGEKGGSEFTFINPVLSELAGEVLGPEGCLSLPGISADVPRAQRVTVDAIDKSGKPFRLCAEDFLARIIQHENDHLDGKLFIDRVSFVERQKLLAMYQSNKGIFAEAPADENRIFRFL